MAGYSNYSMSNNAIIAYSNGEKPFSKWNKNEIIENIIKLNKNIKIELLKKVNLKTLKNRFLYRSSWHHTSEFFNKTDFFSIDENKIENLTNEELEKMIISKKEEKQTEEKEIIIKCDFYFIEWTGTRKHPKAIEKSIENTKVKIKGCFYIVLDDNNNEILRKKIGSNGTYFIKK